MAVHHLFPGSTATTAATPVSTAAALRRSARLGSPCLVATRKRARASDSEQLASSSSSKLPLTPEPTPRSIRAQKRQKTLDGSSPPSPPTLDNGKTRSVKRKALIPDDEQQHNDSDSYNRVVKKRRKENIVNDPLAATATTSSLKINMNMNSDTRNGGGNPHRHRDVKYADQSEPLRYTRNTRSSASKSTLLMGLISKPKTKSMAKSKLQSKPAKPSASMNVEEKVVVPLEPSSSPLTHPSSTSPSSTSPSLPSNSPSSRFASSSRMVTRTMKKLSAAIATAKGRLNSSALLDSAHISTTSSTQSHILVPVSKAGPLTVISPTSGSLSALPSSLYNSNINQLATTTSDATSTNDIQPSTTNTSTSSGADFVTTNDAQSTSDDTATSTYDMQPSTSTTLSSTETTFPPSIDVSGPLSMSFLNVPLSDAMPLPLNMAFLNMPLSMSLSMPLNMSMLSGMSTSLAPSESELGFGFQPQEGFSSTGQEDEQEEDKGKGKEREGSGVHLFMSGERPLLPPPSLLIFGGPTINETASSSDTSLSHHSHPPDRPSSPLLHSSLPPQSCTPCPNPAYTPASTRLAITTCISDQSQPSSTPSMTPIYSPYLSYVNPTSPSYSSPLKVTCFPPLPAPPQPPSPSAPQLAPSLSPLSPSATMSGYERRKREWDVMDMDMAEDQRQQQSQLQQDLAHEMDIELSIPVLSFGNPSLAQSQGQQEPEEDHSPLLGPAPQPLSPQPQTSSPAPLAAQSQPQPSYVSGSSCASSSSRQYRKKIEHQTSQSTEWTPKLDKERSLWRVACKIRVWEITKRYTPDTIRTVVAQEAHDYYSVHGFPLGYGLVPVKSRKRGLGRDRRKILGGADAGFSAAVAAAISMSDSDSTSSSSSMVMTPPSRHRDDEFMNEETYSFELMDDDDDMDGSVGGVGGLRSMEDEWRGEGFEDDDEFGFEDYDEDEDDEDLYDEEEDEDDDQVEEAEGGQMKKGVVSFTTTTPGEEQDQDPDAEGEMEIDIEPFQNSLFNAEPSSPTSPTGSSTSKPKSKSKSNIVVGNEPQSFVSSFYIPPVPPHVQMHMMQAQQERQDEQQQLEEEAPIWIPSSLDSFPNPLSPSTSSSEGPSTLLTDVIDHNTSTADSNDNHASPMQIHLPPASQPYQHQFIPLSPNILPLPPPRLDSVRVYVLRQSEMGGLKTTGRGTPVDRRRGAIWGWGGIGGGSAGGGGDYGSATRGKRRRDDVTEDESDAEGEGEKRGRPRLRMMLADHDAESEPLQGARMDGVKTALRLSLPGDADADVRMPVVPDEDLQSNHETTHKPPSSSSSIVGTDQNWDAFLICLDDKSQPQQQGEEGALDSSITAADRDTTHGQHVLHLDDHLTSRQQHHRHLLQIENERDSFGGAGGLASSPTLEGTVGMFMFDQVDSSGTWFVSGEEEVGDGGRSGGGGIGIGMGGMGGVGGLLAGSSGTCPSDALALEGFNFPVGPDGSSTLSYALG